LPKSEKSSTNPDKHGVVETIYLEFLKKIEDESFCTLDDVVKLIRMLQKYEFDCHISIVGQNGIGKSHVLLMLQKKLLGASFIDNVFMADKTTNDIIDFLLTNEDTGLGIDELSLYFGYKQHATKEQNHLITMIELARSKKIAIIGCARDPRKLTYNYRNGKVNIVIWVPDRFMEGGSYAAVFVANPVVESDDRFGFGVLTGGIVSFDELRELFEHYVPSFRGYMRIPDTKTVLTPEEIALYKQRKDKAMAYAQVNYLAKQLKKKTITNEEVQKHLKVLSRTIPLQEIMDMFPRKTPTADMDEQQERL